MTELGILSLNALRIPDNKENAYELGTVDRLL